MMRTRDLAVRDEDGYFWYKGRSDDLIKSSGFRIGPTEIEECLIAHAAVAEAAAVAKPDAARGAIVKAFVRLSGGFEASEDLSRALMDHVRGRLAAYKAPRRDRVRGGVRDDLVGQGQPQGAAPSRAGAGRQMI